MDYDALASDNNNISKVNADDDFADFLSAFSGGGSSALAPASNDVCLVVFSWQLLLVPLLRLTFLQDSPQPLHPPHPATLTCSLVCRQPLLQSHLALVHLVQQLL